MSCLWYVGVANCSFDCFLVLRQRRQSSSCSTCVLSPTTSPFGWSSRSSRPTQYWRRSVGPHQVVYTHTSHYRPITLHTPYYRSPSHCIHLILIQVGQFLITRDPSLAFMRTCSLHKSIITLDYLALFKNFVCKVIFYIWITLYNMW